MEKIDDLLTNIEDVKKRINILRKQITIATIQEDIRKDCFSRYDDIFLEELRKEYKTLSEKYERLITER